MGMEMRKILTHFQFFSLRFSLWVSNVVVLQSIYGVEKYKNEPKPNN